MLKQFFFILLSLTVAVSAFAQSNSEGPNIFIDLDTGFTFVQNDFTRTWEASPALHLNVRLPFYAGQLQGGFRYTRYKGYAPTQTDSDFSSFYLYVGYSYPLKITSWFYLLPAIRFGNNLMIFDEKEVYTQNGIHRFETDKTESEFAYELVFGTQFQITDRWFINGSLSYNRTLTYYPIEITLFSVGVSYAFPQPNWIQDIIQ